MPHTSTNAQQCTNKFNLHNISSKQVTYVTREMRFKIIQVVIGIATQPPHYTAFSCNQLLQTRKMYTSILSCSNTTKTGTLEALGRQHAQFGILGKQVFCICLTHLPAIFSRYTDMKEQSKAQLPTSQHHSSFSQSSFLEPEVTSSPQHFHHIMNHRIFNMTYTLRSILFKGLPK